MKFLRSYQGLKIFFLKANRVFFQGIFQIIGFFDVSSVSTKRTYFNYEDFYDPESIRPKFVSDVVCEVTFPTIELLREQLENNAVRWYETPIPLPLNQARPVYVVPRRCVDCTVFGTNEKPDFWED